MAYKMVEVRQHIEEVEVFYDDDGFEVGRNIIDDYQGYDETGPFNLTQQEREDYFND